VPAKLEQVIQEPGRLMIMAALSEEEEEDFL
jgi:hypothetical protein